MTLRAFFGGLHCGARLSHAGVGLCARGKCGVAVLLGHQFLVGQLLRACIRRARAIALGLVAAQGGALLGDGGLGAVALLFPVGQVGLRGLQLRLGLFQMLRIDAVVDLCQQLAAAHMRKILHRHLRDIATDLWRDHRDLAMHHRVFGALHRAGERRQPPRIQHQRHADQRKPTEPEHAIQTAATATPSLCGGWSGVGRCIHGRAVGTEGEGATRGRR